MIRRPGPLLTTLLGTGIAALVAAGCGAAPTTSPAKPSATLTPAPTLAGSPAPTGSTAPLPSPSPTVDLGLPHVSAALEDKLPNTIGGVSLEKFSMPLSTYVASNKTGDSVLYTPWLVKFGKTTDDVDLAVAVDLTQTEIFHVQAIEVPGVDAPSLLGQFASVARQKQWPVTPKTVGPKSVLEVVDPATTASGGLGTAYVYADGDILYIVVTDTTSLLLEALIKLPPVPAS